MIFAFVCRWSKSVTNQIDPYLGIEMDNQLDLKLQLIKQISKINRSVGVLKKVPLHTRKNLYNTIVLPHYDTCSVVRSSMSH